MNLIEMIFAKLKTLLRDAKECTVDDLWQRPRKLLDRFGPAECTPISGMQAINTHCENALESEGLYPLIALLRSKKEFS